MSGLVLGRLLNLAPALAPLSLKLDIIEAVWRRQMHLRAGLERKQVKSSAEVRRWMDKAQKALGEMPQQVIERAKWLAGEDTKVYGQLMDHAAGVRKPILTNQAVQQLEIVQRAPVPSGCERTIWLDPVTGHVSMETTKEVRRTPETRARTSEPLRQVSESKPEQPPEREWWESGWLWIGIAVVLLLIMSAG